ncbi:MAG: sugar transporter [Akkermansiaceae bacterium]|nr:sugar transporter [Akkermansiaceae bacterium]
MAASRVQKSLLNAKVDAVFYALALALMFFSRKIFLDCLGADFLGLTGTLQNILGILNLAELGIGAAVAFALYAPLQKDDRPGIESVVSVFGFMYRRVGVFVLGAAVCLSLCLPFIFRNTPFSFSVIYLAFYAFLASSLISYFCNYRSVLLSADQKNYVVNVYFQSGNIIKTLLQMYFAWKYGNYYIWLIIEMVYGGICCWLLNRKIRQVYPWLSASVRKGKALRARYPEIMRRTRQVFVHRIKDFLLTQSDQILIYSFVSLSMVTYYGNYAGIITRSTTMLSVVMNGMNAGVGNLIAEGNQPKILRVFWELLSLRYFIAGVVLFGIYHFIQPFICLWLGGEYLLSGTVLVLMLIVTYISITRGVVDMFNGGYGHYADTWSAWAEGGLNLSISLVAGYFLGLPGLLLGKIVSLFFIIVLWKPYYLFRQGFHDSYHGYWLQVIRYMVASALAFSIVSPVGDWLGLYGWSRAGFLEWALAGGLAVFTFMAVQSLFMFALTRGFRDLAFRLLKLNRAMQK